MNPRQFADSSCFLTLTEHGGPAVPFWEAEELSSKNANFFINRYKNDVQKSIFSRKRIC